MPTSRSRRPRNRPARRTKTAFDPSMNPRVDHLLAAYDESDWAEFDEGMDAEANGDAVRALEIHRRLMLIEGTLREHLLREVILLGEEAPAWLHSRWIVRQAYRWLLLHDPERIWQTLEIVAGCAYADVDPERPLGMTPDAFVSSLISSDWMCMQVAVFELGGLDAFLAGKAGASLLERADQPAVWAQSRIGGFRLDALTDDRMQVIDLASRRALEVLNLGSVLCRDLGSCVIGRVVPIAVEPGLMFESRPLTVDDVTAQQVGRANLRDPLGWVGVVAEGRAAGRLEQGFGFSMPTSLLCDIPGGPPSGIATGRPGEEPDLVAAAVRLCDFVLDQVAADLPTAAFLAPVLLGVLLDPERHGTLRQRCADLPRAAAWEALAEASFPPFRERCQRLADASGRRPAA